MEQVLLVVLGLSFGVFTAGGVFTTVIVVALIPRFAARFHTAYKIEFYEEWIVAGAIAGGIFGENKKNERLQNVQVTFL